MTKKKRKIGPCGGADFEFVMVMYATGMGVIV